MRRISMFSLVLTAALAVVPAAPAAAARPIGACPKPFTVTDRAALTDLLAGLFPQATPEQIEGAVVANLERYDANGDQVLCSQFHDVGGQQPSFANLIDNVRQGRG